MDRFYDIFVIRLGKRWATTREDT